MCLRKRSANIAVTIILQSINSLIIIMMQMNAPYDDMTEQNMQNINLGAPMSANAFNTCNQGIANGFGAMFFNIRDPSFKQTNQPVKVEPSLHVALLVGSIIFFACIIIAGAGYKKFLPMSATIAMIAVSYVLYLVLSIACSELREYIGNMKRNADYEQTYNKMVQGRGYFTFWIECYHYVTVRTKNGTSRRKVVTHTATERYNVTDCVDESGQIGNIMDVKDYIFIHYLKRYYFSEDTSQSRFVAAFNGFVHRNTRDCHQNYTHTFEIEGFEEFTSFSVLGEGGRSRATFYIFTLLGLGLPFSCIFERFVARYEVGLLKRLTI